MVEFLLTTGVRVSEFCDLEIKDIINGVSEEIISKISDNLALNKDVVVHWRGNPFTIEEYNKRPYGFNDEYKSMYDNYNILGNWDEWKCYERLEAECISMLNFEMKQHKKRAETQKQRLSNIVGN